MTNGNFINYVFIYGQVILQLIMYIAIIYLICWPLRDVLYAIRDYLKSHESFSKQEIEHTSKEV